MDWARAKTILIVAFIAVNLFLLFNILTAIFPGDSQKKALDDTLSILRKNGVTLDENCSIPFNSGKLPLLVFEKASVNRTIVESYFRKFSGYGTQYNLTFDVEGVFMYEDKNPAGDSALGMAGLSSFIKDSGVLEEKLKELLLRIGLDLSEFVADRQINEENIIFTEVFRGKLAFDSYVNIIVKNDAISSIVCRITEIKDFSKETGSILPVYLILLKNYSKDYGNKDGIVIESIDLGYKGYYSQKSRMETEIFSESPALRIIEEGNPEARYFKAYDGEEVK